MSEQDGDVPDRDPTGAPEETTPSGEPAVDDDDEDRDPERPQGDPGTGSTEEDPSVAETGLPPAGRDPMAGESPSS